MCGIMTALIPGATPPALTSPGFTALHINFKIISRAHGGFEMVTVTHVTILAFYNHLFCPHQSTPFSMPVEIITKQDLLEFEQRLSSHIQMLFETLSPPAAEKTWLKSEEVMQLLEISPGKLKHLRKQGTLKCTKIGGIFYYNLPYIRQLLDKEL